MRILIVLLLLQEHVPHRSATPPMTLAAVEAEARENNAEIRLMRERLALSKDSVLPSTAVDDPNFSYRAWGTPLLAPWNLNQTQHMFMFSQTVPAGGKRELRYEIAHYGIDIAEAELEARKLDVAAQVRTTFYELLRNRDELRLHEEQIALARQAVASARIRYTAGSAPQHDVLKAQIAVTKLADHFAMFVQDGNLARARLNTLMGRDPAAALEVEGEYVMPAALPQISALQEIAITNRPELKAIEAAMRQLDAKVRLTEKNYKPDISVGAGYMLMPAGSMNRNGYMAEVSFNLPWLNRSRHDSEIREAQSQTRVQRAELEIRRTLVLQEIQEALIRATTAARLVEIYRDTLRPQAQSILRAASAAYQTGQTDFLSLVDSQNTALEVEYSFYRALADFESRIAAIERAIGAPLSRQPQATLEVSHESQ